MRLANGIVLDKERTFGVLKFSALRHEVRVENEDGTTSEEIKRRTYDLKCSQQERTIQVSIPAEIPVKDYPYNAEVELINPVADTVANANYRGADVEWYGNMFYVELVSQYLTVSQVSGELAQKIMNEALKYQGWDYVYGGSNPNTSFDCSGLVQWCYGKAGINLPRTAQAQYDATQHIPLSQAQAGDLVFFHSTYNAGTYVTHVGIYVGNNQMYHAGDPIGYADLTSSYWQQHLIGAGRIKQ